MEKSTKLVKVTMIPDIRQEVSEGAGVGVFVTLEPSNPDRAKR